MSILPLSVFFLATTPWCGKHDRLRNSRQPVRSLAANQRVIVAMFGHLATVATKHGHNCTEFGSAVRAYMNHNGETIRRVFAVYRRQTEGMSDKQRAALSAGLLESLNTFAEAVSRCERGPSFRELVSAANHLLQPTLMRKSAGNAP